MSYTGLCIAIDFDGTCVTHEYPYIGQDVGAVPVLRELVEQGHNLILYTMRSGKLEKEAIQWREPTKIPTRGPAAIPQSTPRPVPDGATA